MSPIFFCEDWMPDVIIVGGGLAGSAVADQLVRQGRSVLILERETRFRDRVRGENMLPWGVGAARRLGILDTITAAGAHMAPFFSRYAMGDLVEKRDLSMTSPDSAPTLNIHHPELQEALLARAVSAGADVMRGATVTALVAEPGRDPQVMVDHEGQRLTLTAPIVVGADGRASQVRGWAGFETQRNPELLTIAGMLVEGSGAPEDSVHFAIGPGYALFLAPLGQRRARMYFVYPGVAGKRGLSGAKKTDDFLAACRSTMVPSAWLEEARAVGPLAEFEGADRWVPSPARNGVALIGDAAASSDPSWGCGLSLTLLDVEALSKAILSAPDRDAALAQYAAAHDEYYGALNRILAWMTELMWTPGPEADDRRNRVFPRWAADPREFPDAAGAGPFGPSDERARRLTLGLEQ